MSTRKELRKEFSDKVLNEELDCEKLVNRYTLWLEQQIIDLLRERKLHQPAVSICSCGSNEYYVEQYKDVTKYYCNKCYEKIDSKNRY